MTLPDGRRPHSMSVDHLIACSRCGRLHGNGNEPPADWAALMDADDYGIGVYTIWGLACPSCRAAVGTDFVRLFIPPTARALEHPEDGLLPDGT